MFKIIFILEKKLLEKSFARLFKYHSFFNGKETHFYPASVLRVMNKEFMQNVMKSDLMVLFPHEITKSDEGCEYITDNGFQFALTMLRNGKKVLIIHFNNKAKDDSAITLKAPFLLKDFFVKVQEIEKSKQCCFDKDIEILKKYFEISKSKHL